MSQRIKGEAIPRLRALSRMAVLSARPAGPLPCTARHYAQRIQGEDKLIYMRYDINPLHLKSTRVSPVGVASVHYPYEENKDGWLRQKTYEEPTHDPHLVPENEEEVAAMCENDRVETIKRLAVITYHTAKLIKEASANVASLSDGSLKRLVIQQANSMPLIEVKKAHYQWAQGTLREGTQMNHSAPGQVYFGTYRTDQLYDNDFIKEIIRFTHGSGRIVPAIYNKWNTKRERNFEKLSETWAVEYFQQNQRAIVSSVYTDGDPYQQSMNVHLQVFGERYSDVTKRAKALLESELLSTSNPAQRKEYDKLLIIAAVSLKVIENVDWAISQSELSTLNACFQAADAEKTSASTEATTFTETATSTEPEIK